MIESAIKDDGVEQELQKSRDLMGGQYSMAAR